MKHSGGGIVTSTTKERSEAGALFEAKLAEFKQRREEALAVAERRRRQAIERQGRDAELLQDWSYPLFLRLESVLRAAEVECTYDFSASSQRLEIGNHAITARVDEVHGRSIYMSIGSVDIHLWKDPAGVEEVMGAWLETALRDLERGEGAMA